MHSWITLGVHWLRTCCATPRAALHEVNYMKTLVPMLMDPSPHQGESERRADLLIFGIDGQPDTYVNMATTCLTAPTFLGGVQARYRKAAHMEF